MPKIFWCGGSLSDAPGYERKKAPRGRLFRGKSGTGKRSLLRRQGEILVGQAAGAQGGGGAAQALGRAVVAESVDGAGHIANRLRQAGHIALHARGLEFQGAAVGCDILKAIGQRCHGLLLFPRLLQAD